LVISSVSLKIRLITLNFQKEKEEEREKTGGKRWKDALSLDFWQLTLDSA
jgi:hypothetical protein